VIITVVVAIAIPTLTEMLNMEKQANFSETRVMIA
jgi:hypothetical protein